MGLVDGGKILHWISPPLDRTLSAQLINEFISIERRYIQRDWEPAQLDGGQFSEIAARLIYHYDSGNLNLSKPFDECVRYIENEQVLHTLIPRQTAKHIMYVLRTVYKFRSQRGAVHISPTYQPNHMDTKLVVEAVRWVMNELLRVFWTGDRESVAKTIRELLQFDVPAIGVFEDVIIVQRTDMSAEEEILIILHHCGDDGASRNSIGRNVRCPPSSITRALQKLASPNWRQVIQLGNGNYRLTDLGSKRIRETLSDKLLIS